MFDKKKIRRALFNSITISLPKNIIQFSIGAVLFWVMFGFPDIGTVAFSLLSFLVAYSSVYLYNDLVDRHDDKRDREKSKWKLIAGGHLSIPVARFLATATALAGLAGSFLVSRWFFGIVALMLLLNFLHSNPRVRFKEDLKKTSVNMTAIEFLKFSCGWFALTSNISEFPFWIILSFSVVYTFSYLIYKFKFKRDTVRKNKKIIVPLAASGVLSYVISVFAYGIPLSLLLLTVIPLFMLLLFRQRDVNLHKINNMIVVEYILLPVIILSFLILSIPFFSLTNQTMAKTIDEYREDLEKNVPDGIITPIDNLTERLEKYGTLEEVERKLKEGIGNASRDTTKS